MNYYDELAEFAEPSRRVGWFDPLDQAFRHALVWMSTPRSPRSVLELGSGEGDFLRHVPESCRYSGVEVREDFIFRARERYPNATFLEGDAFELPLPTAELVVGIGVQIGNVVTPSALVSRVAELSEDSATLLVLKAEWLDSRPLVDHELRGMSKDALERSARSTGLRWRLDGDILESDWLLRLSRAEIPPVDSGAVLDAALAMTPNATPGMNARLAFLRNDFDQLRDIALRHPDDALVTNYLERTRMREH